MVKESKQASKQANKQTKRERERERENSNRRQTFFIPIRDIIHSQPKQKKWDSRKRLNDQKNEVRM